MLPALLISLSLTASPPLVLEAALEHVGFAMKAGVIQRRP